VHDGGDVALRNLERHGVTGNNANGMTRIAGGIDTTLDKE
jgi:hypothetical protein